MFFGCWYYKNVAPPGLMLTYTLSKYNLSDIIVMNTMYTLSCASFVSQVISGSLILSIHGLIRLFLLPEDRRSLM
jgi:hypothetical protein